MKLFKLLKSLLANLISKPEWEWRCECPYNKDYDTSINPSFFSECSKCGCKRPIIELKY